MNDKRYRTCGKYYPATPHFFQRAAFMKDGLKTQCKFCSSEAAAKEYADRKARIEARIKAEQGQ